MPEINWYPGHMAKTRRLLNDQLKLVDAVIELCDARAPQATRNPDLGYMCRGKPRVLVLNKADLADDNTTSRWMAHYRGMGLNPMRFNSTGARSGELLSAIEQACMPVMEKLRARGVSKTARVMVIGIPNVGKSTLINRLINRTQTRAEDRPGVTRHTQWVKAGPYLEILDTPGMLWPKLSDQGDARILAYLGSIRDDILDREALATDLIKTLYRLSPKAVCERFHISDEDIDPPEPAYDGTWHEVETVLDRVCVGRGWLLSGGRHDTARAASIVLDEFRAGMIGKLSLQMPGDQARNEAPLPVIDSALSDDKPGTGRKQTRR